MESQCWAPAPEQLWEYILNMLLCALSCLLVKASSHCCCGVSSLHASLLPFRSSWCGINLLSWALGFSERAMLPSITKRNLRVSEALHKTLPFKSEAINLFVRKSILSFQCINRGNKIPYMKWQNMVMPERTLM